MSRVSVSGGRDASPSGDRSRDRSISKDKNRESTTERSLRSEKEVEKLVYAIRGSTKTVELFSENLKCLDQNKYLNDEIVQVYIAYLMYDRGSPNLQKQVHVFDSCFHQFIKETFNLPGQNKKSDLVDEKTRYQIKTSNWKRLNKWFPGVDLFEKNFLIFPICHDQHWSAIIVCYPLEVKEPWIGEQPGSPDQSSDTRNKPVPGIIILDSLGLKNSLHTMEVRQFLDFEWRTRCTVVKDFYYHNLKEYKPKLPKQTNSYDCGIFMLTYLRAFVDDPETFYRHVRRGQTTDQEALSQMVFTHLPKCSRESIKTMIQKKFQSERRPRS